MGKPEKQSIKNSVVDYIIKCGDEYEEFAIIRMLRRIICLFRGHNIYYDGGIITERIGRYCCGFCGKTFYGKFID